MPTTKAAWLAPILAGGLLLAALSRSSDGPVPVAGARAAFKAPEDIDVLLPEGPVLEKTEAPVKTDYWSEIQALREFGDAEFRRRGLSMTTAHLGLSSGEAATFEGVALRALAGIERAWKERDMIVVQGTILDDEAIDAAYKRAKGVEEASILGLLGSSPEHLEFRDRLGEWIDALR